MSANRQLYRSESKRMLGGVCGGLSDFLGLDATVVRVLFLLLSFVGGAGILLYPAMWIVVPTESRVGAPPADIAREGWREMRGRLPGRARS